MSAQTQLSPVVSPPLVDSQATPQVRLLGRQPIIDEHQRLFGHELLFRCGTEDAFSGDPEAATREVVDQCAMLIPELNEGRAFVNCTRLTFVEGICTLLPPESTVLEILETIEPDAELLSSLRLLKTQGYQLALDDFAPLRSREPLIELADFVKIDFLASDQRARQEIYSMLHGSRARLLAEKIETHEEMLIARGEGCSLFQGYFFARPVTLSKRAVPQNQMIYLQLLTALNREPTELTEIEKLILSDASLCYRVLRLANSPVYFHARELTSVREALLLVGENAVRRIVTVAIAGILAGNNRSPVVLMALVRARFCELIAGELGAQPAQLYLLGLLSLLDVLLEIPMERILTALPIDSSMKAALLGEPGLLRQAIDLVHSLEACDWHESEKNRASLGIGEGEVSSRYVEALRWSHQALRL